MKVKVKLNSGVSFKYDCLNIGEFIDIIQIMTTDRKPVLIAKSDIECIRIYIDTDGKEV